MSKLDFIRKIRPDENLVLVVKSKNKPGSPVYREDLPSILYNKAPRIILGASWFNEYSNRVRPSFKICDSCKKQGSIERHELYGLYKLNNIYVIKLEGIMNICNKCHQKIHGGFSTRLNMGYGFVRDPVPVSDSLNSRKYPWNEAIYLLVEDSLYSL